MIINDLNKKVIGRFIKEVIIDDDGDGITYIFPNTEEFISVLNRKFISKKMAEEKV